MNFEFDRTFSISGSVYISFLARLLLLLHMSLSILTVFLLCPPSRLYVRTVAPITENAGKAFEYPEENDADGRYYCDRNETGIEDESYDEADRCENNCT